MADQTAPPPVANSQRQAARLLGISHTLMQRLTRLLAIGTPHGRHWTVTDADLETIREHRARTPHAANRGRPRRDQGGPLGPVGTLRDQS